MRGVFCSVLQIVLILMWAGDGFAQQGPTVEERLIRLEEGQKALIQRIEDTNRRIEDTNRRIDDLRADVNGRLDDMQFWVQLLVGVVSGFGLVLVGGWITLAVKVSRVETRVQDHLPEAEKDRLLAFQREEIEALKARVERLEVGRT